MGGNSPMVPGQVRRSTAWAESARRLNSLIWNGERGDGEDSGRVTPTLKLFFSPFVSFFFHRNFLATTIRTKKKSMFFYGERAKVLRRTQKKSQIPTLWTESSLENKMLRIQNNLDDYAKTTNWCLHSSLSLFRAMFVSLALRLTSAVSLALECD